jgi:GH15 family glucan-1,4-alpha-glucosidase
MSTTGSKKEAPKDGPANRPNSSDAGPGATDGRDETMPQSAAMPSPFPPIADYAFLSDCHTGALLAPDGSINWLCVPRFDAPSIFGTLLDRQAGDMRFGPFGVNVPSARIYEPGTNILLTTWRTPTGWAIVRDALIIGPRRGVDKITPHTRPPTDEDAEHLLVRVAMCLSGEVEIELTCEPAFDYGSVPAEWTLGEDGHCADASGAEQAIRLTTSMALGTEGDRVRARHELKQGEQIFCSLSWAEGFASPQSLDEANERLATTAAFWRDWLSRARIPDHRWRDPIQRSALAIKGLTYMPTGATVAALTTSLPETPGGERNWDYRYTWLRDSTFTLQALHFLNLDWEAEEFMQFVADLEPNADGGLQIMYGIDGRRDLSESTRDDLSGYAGASPVRVGNGAFDQRQNDVYGAALSSILLHTRRSKRLPRRLWPLVQAQAECASKIWREPDQGIWEARGAPQHYVSSKLMCWVAMDSASKLAEIRGDGKLQAGWRAIAEEIREDILAHGLTKDGVLRQWRRAPARERARDRGRPDRGRLRAALPHGRDRRRPVRQGGQLPDLLLLAGLRPGRDRRGAARARFDGTALERRLAARAVRGGVRHEHRSAPRELPPGVLASGADRGGGANHPLGDARGDHVTSSRKRKRGDLPMNHSRHAEIS